MAVLYLYDSPWGPEHMGNDHSPHTPVTDDVKCKLCNAAVFRLEPLSPAAVVRCSRLLCVVAYIHLVLSVAGTSPLHPTQVVLDLRAAAPSLRARSLNACGKFCLVTTAHLLLLSYSARLPTPTLFASLPAPPAALASHVCVRFTFAFQLDFERSTRSAADEAMTSFDGDAITPGTGLRVVNGLVTCQSAIRGGRRSQRRPSSCSGATSSSFGFLLPLSNATTLAAGSTAFAVRSPRDTTADAPSTSRNPPLGIVYMDVPPAHPLTRRTNHERKD
ncbi:hypothetical protein FB451DRAFT_444610 [Mycena latifolia]|nr:hypothetical protein FB451DRAFT_444610 [Mycena latifolia]